MGQPCGDALEIADAVAYLVRHGYINVKNSWLRGQRQAARIELLRRELQEELGIEVTACHPWLRRQFTYPHATVRLHFWQVTAWQGEIGVSAPLEHSAAAWVARGCAPQLAPILPANGPILKALELPETLLI